MSSGRHVLVEYKSTRTRRWTKFAVMTPAAARRFLENRTSKHFRVFQGTTKSPVTIWDED